MELHGSKKKKYDQFKIYVRNERGWFTYNIVNSRDAKDSALRHLDELAESYEIREYMVVGYNKEMNMDEVCDVKTYAIIEKRESFKIKKI